MNRGIIILVVVVFALMSWIIYREINVDDGDKISSRYTIIEMEHKGHTYIVAEKSYKGGITHSPDCECKNGYGTN